MRELGTFAVADHIVGEDNKAHPRQGNRPGLLLVRTEPPVPSMPMSAKNRRKRPRLCGQVKVAGQIEARPSLKVNLL